VLKRNKLICLEFAKLQVGMLSQVLLLL